MRRIAAIATCSLLALALATGAAFAGRGVGGDNGTKNGVDNKKQSYSCPDGYERWDYQWGNPADINDNGTICAKWTADSWSYVDDTSWKWD